MEGRWLMEKGCSWKVSNGQSIYAIKDKWIPNIPGNRTQLRNGEVVLKDFRVQNPFGEEEGTWNNELIKDLFSSSIATNIKATPLQVSTMALEIHSQRHIFVAMWVGEGGAVGGEMKGFVGKG